MIARVQRIMRKVGSSDCLFTRARGALAERKMAQALRISQTYDWSSKSISIRGSVLKERENFYIDIFVLMTYVANSLLNPAIYALRIPGFREDLVQVFCCAHNRITPVDLLLRISGTSHINH